MKFGLRDRFEIEDTMEIRTIRSSEVPFAAAVLGRGMRDNPLHMAALGAALREELVADLRVAAEGIAGVT